MSGVLLTNKMRLIFAVPPSIKSSRQMARDEHPPSRVVPPLDSVVEVDSGDSPPVPVVLVEAKRKLLEIKQSQSFKKDSNL